MQPSPIFLPGKLLVGYSPWGGKESDTTEQQQQQKGCYIQSEAETRAAKPSPTTRSCSSRWGMVGWGALGFPTPGAGCTLVLQQRRPRR